MASPMRPATLTLTCNVTYLLLVYHHHHHQQQQQHQHHHINIVTTVPLHLCTDGPPGFYSISVIFRMTFCPVSGQLVADYDGGHEKGI